VAVPPIRAAARPRVIDAGRKALRAAVVPSHGLELPVSNQFRVWDAIAGCFLTPKNRIRALLSAHGYVEAPASYPTVEGFKKVGGDGVFVIFAHGGAGEEKDKSKAFSLWTSTNVGLDLEGKYDAMWDAFELSYMMMPGRNASGLCANTVINYGVTPGFVAHYMHFARNSLVYLNVCDSGTPDAGDMRQAFGNANASVVVGWDASVSVGTTFRTVPYFIDRLLGSNDVEPREDPKQRAFNVYDVRDNMAAKGRTVEPLTGAQLTIFKMNNDFGLLAPSIQFLSNEDDGVQPHLIIAGMFGADPGEGKRSVTINDTELDNIHWSPTEIDCDIPEAGSNASGTVVVKVGSGTNARESNHVNLTEWIAELTYDRDDPGDLAAQMTIKLRILADIHPFREKPGEQPFETTVLFPPRGDTNMHMTTSGTYEETLGDCKDTYTFGQGGDVGTPFGTGEGKDGSWSYFGSVDTQSHTLQLNIAVLGVFKAGTYVRTRIGPGDCDTFNVPQWVSLAIDECLYDDLVQSPAFRMQMGDDFTVPEDNRGPCDAKDPLIGQVNDNHAQGKIKWAEMTPFYPPDPDAAR
jgi:hypothetical protein